MKKLLSLALCAALGASLFAPAYAETDAAMEKTLAAVKDKVDIPEGLTVFRAGKSGVDEKSYRFSWTDEENDSSLSVTADSAGHIIDYNYGYNVNPENKSSLPTLNREDAKAVAEKFMRKAAPELFGNENDKLVLYEEFGNPSVGESWYNFGYERVRDGAAVWNNNANVSVIAYKDTAFVSWCDIEWDYEATFADGKSELENPAESYFAAFPAELRYERMYGWRAYKSSVTNTDSDVRLLYGFKDAAGYISAADGSEVEPYVKERDRIMNGSSGGGMSQMAKAETSDAGDFTDEELEELDTFNNLISAQTAERNIRALPNTGMTADMKLSNSEVYRQKTWEYRDDKGIEKEKIVMRLYFATDDGERGLYASVDAQSGELLSISSYSYDDEKKASGRDAAADIEKFLKAAAAPEKLGACEALADKQTETDNDWVYLYLRRKVNGVPYNDNGININYNKARGAVVSYSIEWDEDVSAFTPAEAAIDMAAAKEKMLTYAPLKLMYIPTKDNYVLCYGIDYTQNAAIDAVTGEQAYKDSDEESRNISYSDISGHWAENAIKALAEMGLSEPADKFRPDEKITQENLLRFIGSAFGGYSVWDSDSEDLYDNLIRAGVVKKDEKNPNAEVLRTDAFVFFVREMGYEKIAELTGIFNCGFSDAGQIAADRLGYAAILSGLGVISGDGNAIRANDALTNAEAAAMIYNYLKTND